MHQNRAPDDLIQIVNDSKSSNPVYHQQCNRHEKSLSSGITYKRKERGRPTCSRHSEELIVLIMGLPPAMVAGRAGMTGRQFLLAKNMRTCYSIKLVSFALNWQKIDYITQ